jgi:glycyl-tRNA synthetase beta chain
VPQFHDDALPYVYAEGDDSKRNFEILWLNRWGPIETKVPSHEEVLNAVLLAIPDTEGVLFVQSKRLGELEDDLPSQRYARPISEIVGRLVSEEPTEPHVAGLSKNDVLDFLADRLKVALREKGTRHDLIDAVFSLGNEDDLVRLVARVEALQSFLKTDDGANLLTAYKRAANILKAEEKKDKTTFDGAIDSKLLALPEEKALAEALGAAEKAIAADVQAEQFVEAMGVMAGLRKPVDAFFDKVTVNDKDANLRENRLKLLARLRATLHLVADFSKIEG